MASARLVRSKYLQLLLLLSFAPRMLLVFLRYQILKRIVGEDTAVLDATDIMRGWRGVIGMLARRRMLRVLLGTRFGDHVTVYNVLLSTTSICVGENTYIGFDCNLGHAQIGSNVLISDGVIIMSGGRQHGTSHDGKSLRRREGEYRCVVIGDDAWIGAGAIVMADVGPKAIVGAGSVVTRPVPEGQVHAGVPARGVARALAKAVEK